VNKKEDTSEMHADCRYFATYSGVKLPLHLVGPIPEAALTNRNTFMRALFDGAGRLIVCEKIVYGEVEMAHHYEYYANGALKSAEIRMPDEEPALLTFVEDGPEHRLSRQIDLLVERQHANDVGVRDAQAGEEAERVDAAAVFGDHEVDMGIGQRGLGVGGRTDGKNPVAGLVGQKVQRIGPFCGVLRHGQDCSELVHVILLFSSNTFLAVLTRSINFPVGRSEGPESPFGLAGGR
jgi:hypothetical protein